MNTEKTIIRLLRYRSSISLGISILLVTLLNIRIGLIHPIIVSILCNIVAIGVLFLSIEHMIRTSGISAAKRFVKSHAATDPTTVIDFYFQLQSITIGPYVKRSFTELILATVPTAKWQKGRVVFTTEIEEYESTPHQAVA